MASAWLRRKVHQPGRIGVGTGPVLPNRGGGDSESQLGQFVANAGTAPSRIGRPHPADESNQLRVLGGPSATTSRLPTPEHAPPGPVPPGHRLRSADHQRVAPVGPLPFQGHPEPAVWPLQSGLAHLSAEYSELVPESEILQAQFVLGAKPGPKVAQEQQRDSEHGRALWRQASWNQRLPCRRSFCHPQAVGSAQSVK